MKADTVDLAAIFGQQVCYRIPMFQRPYVWEEETEWIPLWEDIQAVLERQLDDTPANDQIPHFLGAVVFDQVLNQTGKVQARYVIDGQQRLTTLQLFIAAARSVALEQDLEDAARVFGMLLFNEEFLVRSSPDDRLKVAPSRSDRQAFNAAIEETSVSSSSGTDHLIAAAYRFFRRSIVSWAVEGHAPDETSRRVEILSAVLWKLLVVVAIDLEARDNAQVIFETLNARGTPLLAADLIKNHLFQVAMAHGLDIDALYAAYWEPFDKQWWRKKVQVGRLKRPRLDIFMNHWLSMRLVREVGSHQLFPEFKRFIAVNDQPVVDLLKELAEYGVVYEAFTTEADRFSSEGFGSPRAGFLYRLNTMEVTTAYPFLLWVFGPEGIRDEGERMRALAVIDSWLARRVILRGNTQGYSTIFLALLANLRKAGAHSATEIAAYFRALEGERGYWPTDEQVRTALSTSPLYPLLLRRRLRMVLESIEEALQRKAGVEVKGLRRDLTVEHVLPRQWEANWDPPIGADPEAAVVRRDVLKHTIGNLMLITGSLNSEQSNRAWEEKRKLLNERSTLLVSAEVRTEAMWDEGVIEARSRRLADVVVNLWPGPTATVWD